MRIRPYARAILALIAAYAVALQTILVVLGGPLAGGDDFATRPICSSSAGGATDRAPAGHAHDCLAACLTGCCCGAAVVPVPRTAVVYAMEPVATVATAAVPAAILRLTSTGAHRSRAPPAA